MRLDEFAPTNAELDETRGMPEQVAIGYIRAQRKAHGGRRTDRPFGDLFGGMFGNGTA